jgi:hypothetical protein
MRESGKKFSNFLPQRAQRTQRREEIFSAFFVIQYYSIALKPSIGFNAGE